MITTYSGLASEIKNIRYDVPGKIAFDFRGRKILIREPHDVLLVGFSQAPLWIAKNYSILLDCLDNTEDKSNE